MTTLTGFPLSVLVAVGSMDETHVLNEKTGCLDMRPELREQYRASLRRQLNLWLNGRSVHTTDLPTGIDPECCPDFSCCFPSLRMPLKERIRYAQRSKERWLDEEQYLTR